ncbi:hypothetical protein Bca52824_075358 [Brassica carinata]|uniref:DUF4283 domain-containing protein n=1 Tax=Brassica carinata TaxID=52824 RepID=A0A8X7TWA9_BRACI|nr:hypothetical protein Bca52824_075358 [Brassica carinata]
MIFNINGKDTLVEYIYPWFPSRCSNYLKWGHLEKACLAPKKDSCSITPNNVDVEEGEITGSSLKENEQEQVAKEQLKGDKEEEKNTVENAGRNEDFQISENQTEEVLVLSKRNRGE